MVCRLEQGGGRCVCTCDYALRPVLARGLCAHYVPSVISRDDERIAAKDSTNTLERRSVRCLDAEIKKLEEKLYMLRFVRETIERQIQKGAPGDRI